MSIPESPDRIQRGLLLLAAAFMVVYALALTLSPAARARSWEVDYRWSHWLGVLIWGVFVVLAHHQSGRILPQRDPYLLPIVALLSGWGLLTIWRLYPSFGLRQTVWLIVAGGLFVAGLRLPGQLSFLRRYKYLWLTAGLALTALTLLLGTNPTGGAGPRLWLGCCGVYFQPSEPLKLLLIVYLAAYLADRQPLLPLSPAPLPPFSPAPPPPLSPAPLLPLLAPTFIMTGLALLLLMVQRDLGTASIFIFLYAAIIYIATGRTIIVAVSALALGLGGTVAYMLFDVVRLRVDAWLNPWLDPSGRSYQIVQSLLAIANGGLFGRGPGLGNPALVPVSHSDFIFTAIAEESGLLGIVALVLLLALLTIRGLYAALHAPDRYRRYLAAGLTVYLIAQSILIMGGNLRLLPLTGVTLPFVSYGGSSLLTAFLSLLLLLHISNRAENRPAPRLNIRPYAYMGTLLLIGLGVVAIGGGWWAYYRGPALLTRTDNARRAIADRYVRRGSLLDRRNTPLAASLGLPGDFARQTLYPTLGPVIGYNHPIYGQSGLEAGLDAYLRGLRGNPALTIWWSHLLYGQPPPGLDVRLSLDLDLQTRADELLGDHAGALVLLNAQSGEILALASHPTFDPNLLDETWEELIEDLRAPLFNRATLGRYQPGTALAPFFLANIYAHGELPPLPEVFSYPHERQQLECARSPFSHSWEAAIAVGCPATQVALGSALGEAEALALYRDLGFYSAPSIPLPTGSLPLPQAFSSFQNAILGRTEISLSPLQMAFAVATLSNGGVRPSPRLTMAVKTPLADWVVLPPEGQSVSVFEKEAANRVAEDLAMKGLPAWQSIALAPNGSDRTVTWYLAGSLPDRHGAPLTLVVLLEARNPALAETIGRAMIQAVLPEASLTHP